MSSRQRIDLLLKMQADVAQLKNAGREVRRMKRETISMGAELKRGLAMGVGFAGIATGAAGAAMAIRSIAAAGITTNANLEQQQVAFETLLGSAEAAQKRVADLVKFSAKTPFELEPLVNANKLLQAMGGNTLASAEGMQLVGDAAAAVGRPISDLSMWVGRLYAGLQSGTPVGEATLRLIEMGAITGETKRGLDEMARSAHGHAGAMKILQDTFGGYAGAMEKQSRTFNGLMTTMKDNFNLAAAEKMKPFFEVIKSGLSGILLQMGIVNPEIAKFTNQLQSRFSTLSDEVKNSSVDSIETIRAKIKEAQAELDSLQQAQETIAAKGNPGVVMPSLTGGGPMVFKDIFGFLGDPAGQAEKKIEAITTKIADLQQLLAVAGDESALSQLIDRSTIEKKIAAHREKLARPNNGLDPIEERAMERRLAGLEEQLALWDRIDAQRQRTATIDTVLAEEAAAAKAVQIEEQRKTIFDQIAEAREKTAKAEFELLMSSDQQVAALQDRKSEIEQTLAKTLELAATQEQKAEAELYYRTQIAAVENEILDIREKQTQTVDSALNSFFKEIDKKDPLKEVGEAQLVKIDRYTDSIRSNFTSLIQGTRTWKQALEDIGQNTLSEMLLTIHDLFAEWIAGMLKRHILGQTLQAKETATGTAAAATQAAAWTPAAFLSSVASFGASIAAGALLMAAVSALSGGFAEGGYTGPGSKHKPAGIVHAGEFVFPKDVVDSIGTGALYDMMGSVRGFAGGGAVGPIFSQSASAPGNSDVNLNLALVDSRKKAERSLRGREGERIIMDIAKRRFLT